KCLGRLEVNRELEFGRLLDRQVSGPGTLEDLVNVLSRSAEHVAEVRPIGHQRASLDEVFLSIDHWQARIRRQCEKRLSMIEEVGIDNNVQSLSLRSPCSRKSRIKVLGRSCAHKAQLD